MWIVGFPIPHYGQTQAHVEAWPELCRMYREMTGRTPPETYTEEGYEKLHEALNSHTPNTDSHIPDNQ